MRSPLSQLVTQHSTRTSQASLGLWSILHSSVASSVTWLVRILVLRRQLGIDEHILCDPWRSSCLSPMKWRYFKADPR